MDEAFGYGRGIHNMMRAIHSNPKKWAKLAGDQNKLKAELQALMDQGLFYLRYTTGDPAKAFRKHAIDSIAQYVSRYAPELERVDFEPERPFETLIEKEQVLISGAMDLIRLDDPPRVTLIDFKSGDAKSDSHSALDEELMRLQVAIYGLAARRELEYEPDRGFVRYLGEADPNAAELDVALDDASIAAAKEQVVQTANAIRSRDFSGGPRKRGTPENPGARCSSCDYADFCGVKHPGVNPPDGVYPTRPRPARRTKNTR